jgi:hypothetical protein
MKKVIIPLILLLAVAFLIAVESDPSAVVGYVKYDLLAGRNMVALPMASGYTMASNLGDAIGAQSVAKWNATNQGWDQADNFGFMWVPDFAVADGNAYMVNVNAAGTYYCAGAMITQPNYSLVIGRNAVMVPLDRSDLSMASTFGNAIGNLSAVAKWNATNQGWDQADNFGFMWVPDFAVQIGMPLMVNSSAVATWPTTRTSTSTFRSGHGRSIK